LCEISFAEEQVPSGAIKLEHDGVVGMWMPMEMARKSLSDAKELKITKENLQLIDTKLSIKNERILYLNEIKLNLEKELSVVEESHNACLAELDEVEDPPWYKHPALWLGVGIVLTVVVEVAAVATFNAISGEK